jgi:hypothetical protein
MEMFLYEVSTGVRQDDIKAYRWNRSIDPHILILHTRRRVIRFTTEYSCRQEPYYPLRRSLVGPHSRSGLGVREKVPFACLESGPDSPNRYPAPKFLV